MKDYTNSLFKFIKNSPSAYHTVASVRAILLERGYKELYEGDSWQIEKGEGYFVTRGGSSIIAFRSVADTTGYNICASHSDFPAFRLRQSFFLLMLQ